MLPKDKTGTSVLKRKYTKLQMRNNSSWLNQSDSTGQFYRYVNDTCVKIET